MGMFDEVQFDVLYCPYCGNKEEAAVLQTKAGRRLLDKYTREEFEEEIYQISEYRVIGGCSRCGEYIKLLIDNKSKKHEEFVSERTRATTERLRKEQTELHPNHKFVSGKLDNKSISLYVNGHCTKCSELGVRAGEAPPDMESFND